VTNSDLGLFNNDRESNLQSTVAMVEDVLIELGHFLNKCRYDAPDALRAWRLDKDDATVSITLVDEQDFVHIRAEATLMDATSAADRLALLERALILNVELQGAAFALRKDELILFAERSTLDLDRSEALGFIRRIRSYATKYRPVLLSLD
jgi:hypothetical protein